MKLVTERMHSLSEVTAVCNSAALLKCLLSYCYLLCRMFLCPVYWFVMIFFIA